MTTTTTTTKKAQMRTNSFDKNKNKNKNNGGRQTATTRSSWWILSMVLFATTQVALVHSNNDHNHDDTNANIDPGTDFGGYMQEMDHRERDERAFEAKLRAHDDWRKNTWGGLAVRTIQGLSRNHLKPLFLAVQDALRNTSNSSNNSTAAQMAMYVGVRVFLIVLLLAFVYVGARIMQLVIGSDYEVVEEIVVVHEHETEDDAARARARTTRGKKVKAKAS